MRSDDKKAAVCYHEAGHWVVANHLGFKTGGITVQILKNGNAFGHEGSATVFPRLQSNSPEAIDVYLKNRIAVLFSGVLAQVLQLEWRNENTAAELLQSDGADDYKTVNELLCILRGVRYSYQNERMDDQHIMQLQTECWIHADEIVKDKKTIIIRLAENMAKKIRSFNSEYEFSHKELNEWACTASKEAQSDLKS